MRPRGVSDRKKFPAGSEFAGNSDLFAKICAETALDSKGLRQNSVTGAKVAASAG